MKYIETLSEPDQQNVKLTNMDKNYTESQTDRQTDRKTESFYIVASAFSLPMSFHPHLIDYLHQGRLR